MLDEFREADVEQMRQVQGAIVQACLPFLEGRTHPALVAIALARACRTVLRKAGSRNDRLTLTGIIVAFIEGQHVQPTDPGRRIILSDN